MNTPGPRLTAALVGVVVLVAIGACGPAAAEPSAISGSATPGPGDAGGGALPLLVDTDVAPDHLVAIAFLLASPRVEVEAITVSGTGEAHCGAGVDVVLRLLERLDAPPIDVACGRETPIAGDHAFPDAWRANADDGAGLALPATARQPFPWTRCDSSPRLPTASTGCASSHSAR